jgi:hypothetical protein
MWKEVVMTYFKALSQNLPEGPMKTTKKLIQDSWTSGQYLSLEPPEI